MLYIEKTLLKNERLIFWCKPHWIIFAPAFLGLIFSLLILNFSPTIMLPPPITSLIDSLIPFSITKAFAALVAITAIYWLITALVAFTTSEYAITNKRVVIKIGLVRRETTEIFLDKVEAIQVDQTILGRLLGYGVLSVVGTGGTSDPYPNVPDPLKFRRRVQKEIDAWYHSAS